MANTSKGERHTTVIRLPVETYESIAAEAQKIGISLNEYMCRLIALGRLSESAHGMIRTEG